MKRVREQGQAIGKKQGSFARVWAVAGLASVSLAAVAGLCDWTWVGGCTTVDCQRIWCGKDDHINTIVYCQTQNEGTVCCQCTFDYWTCKGSLPCPNPSMVEKKKQETQGAECQGSPSLECVF